MDIPEKAFRGLYPDKEPPELLIKYSHSFNEYNGNVRITSKSRTVQKLQFHLSKNFLEAEEEITIGLVQTLLNKVYNTKIKSMEQDLYESFTKHLTRYAKRKESDESLISLFHELNDEYFGGMMEQPNLTFGTKSTTILGTYKYATDTVRLSTVLQERPELLKFVLYHELLHKKHSYTTTNGRSQYHTKAFRDDEKKFVDPQIQKKLDQFVRRKKFRFF